MRETESQIAVLEEQIAGSAGKLGGVYRLQTLPGVGKILGPARYLEMGDAEGFATAEKFAGYCGLVSRVHSSGGHTRQGRLRKECNASLTWAFVEAAEAIVCHQGTMSHQHVVRLYQRMKRDKKGGGGATLGGGGLAHDADEAGLSGAGADGGDAAGASRDGAAVRGGFFELGRGNAARVFIRARVSACDPV